MAFCAVAYFFSAQVLMPNTVYNGHQPMAPVASGTMPM
jgi:hypothetical protein